MHPTVLHLHGLGSSPASDKAVVLGERLRACGFVYLVPDLELPSFERLSLTAVIDRVAELAVAQPPGPLALVGSSFGGLAALHLVDRRPEATARIERLVLLAPALDLLGDADRRREAGELESDWLERWRKDGFLDLPHSASGEERPVHYALVEELRGYDSFTVDLRGLPTLIYHGRNDESVPFRQSVRFAEDRPEVDLRLLDTDHRLSGQLDTIGDGIIDFLRV